MAAIKSDPRRFVTSGGKEIELMPVPPLQAEMARAAAMKEAVELFGEAKKPTYTTSMDETLEHDEESIKEAGDEERAAWAKYLEIDAKTAAHVGQATMRFFLFYGVNADPEADKSWEQRQKFFKIVVPDDPIERKIHYIQTELIFSRDDMEGITTRIMALAGVRPEVVEAAVNSFRD